MIPMLEKLEKYRDKAVRIIFTNGSTLLCEPLQFLEEEYESYMVRSIEATDFYPKGTLMEIYEEDVKDVQPV